MEIIRKAEKADLGAILDIYNDAVINTTATFDTEPRTLEKQIEWFNEHKGKYQILVYEIDSIITGWASLSQWSDRPAYRQTAENSVYVKKDFRNRGIGKNLLNRLLTNAGENGFHTIIARVAENEVSIKIHTDLGFKIIGIMKEAGKKFGRYIDVTIMQRML